MVENLAICVIINWLYIIYMFTFSLYLSEKAQNGKHYVHGRVKVKAAPALMMTKPLIFPLSTLENCPGWILNLKFSMSYWLAIFGGQSSLHVQAES